MTHSEATARFCSDLIGGLADAGVTHVFISPGSRNTPLTLAAVADPRITDISVRDERSAGFMALGLAKASATPAAVISTSGSASAHYLPAIVEADQSSTPLVVLTSDRPVRLRGSSAPQTMDQVNLYGSHVLTFVDADTVSMSGREVAIDAIATGTSGIPGPVHINVPIDEPLVSPTSLEAAKPQPVAKDSSAPTAQHVVQLPDLDRVLIIASGHQREGFARALDRVSGVLQAPVIADIQTRVSGDRTLSHPDLILGVNGQDGPLALERLRPELILRLGPLPTSKPLWQWLESTEVPQILVDNTRLSDPLHSPDRTIREDPTAFLEGLDLAGSSDPTFLNAWQAMDAHAGSALAPAIDSLSFPNEPQVARTLAESLQIGSIMFMASSRPIRDVDAYANRFVDPMPLANRGLNGIDGTISSAIGAALSGNATTLLIGDIASLHDVSAIAEAAALGVALRIVVVNNNGGGIFSFLPQASSSSVQPDVFERHWGTPHGLSIAPIARAMGVPSTTIDSLAEFERRISRPPRSPELLELHTDRTTNVDHHRSIRQAVQTELLNHFSTTP